MCWTLLHFTSPFPVKINIVTLDVNIFLSIYFILPINFLLQISLSSQRVRAHCYKVNALFQNANNEMSSPEGAEVIAGAPLPL